MSIDCTETGGVVAAEGDVGAGGEVGAGGDVGAGVAVDIAVFELIASPEPFPPAEEAGGTTAVADFVVT